MIRIWLVRSVWIAGVALAFPITVLLGCAANLLLAAAVLLVHNLGLAEEGDWPDSWWNWDLGRIDAGLIPREIWDVWWLWPLCSLFALCLWWAWSHRRREQATRARRPSHLLPAIAVGLALLTVVGVLLWSLARLDYRAEKARLVALVGQRVFGDERFPHREISYRLVASPNESYRMFLVWTFTCNEALLARARAAPRNLPFDMRLSREGTVQVIVERF